MNILFGLDSAAENEFLDGSHFLTCRLMTSLKTGDAMLLPYGTDASLRRPPWGTFSLITVNVSLFLMQDSITPQNW